MIDDLVIVEEEEHLVLPDRTANGGPKIVVVERSKRRRFAISVVVRLSIKGVVLYVVVGGAVKMIGASLADLVDDHAANAVLRRERRQRNLQLVHGLKNRGVGVLAMRQR